MVGAWVLSILAIVSGGLGMVLWLRADTDFEAGRGLTLLAICAVTLSAALLIDAIRYYANRISNQIDWLLKPTGVVGATRVGSVDRTPTVSKNGASLTRYHVVGKDERTGLETELVVQVANETEALKVGERHGIEVQRVTPTY